VVAAGRSQCRGRGAEPGRLGRVRPEGPAWWVLLLGFQSLVLFAWAVLLWTPAPVAPPYEPPA